MTLHVLCYEANVLVIKKKQCCEDAENWLLTAPEGYF